MQIRGTAAAWTGEPTPPPAPDAALTAPHDRAADMHTYDTAHRIPGLVKTGEKQGKLIVYRYDSEVTAAAARRRLQHSCVSYCCCCPA